MLSIKDEKKIRDDWLDVAMKKLDIIIFSIQLNMKLPKWVRKNMNNI